ncbi:hypothetical protein FDE76_07605 [Clostridium botulinum]|uniref:Uncharacterized protein n=1 Tax=Clostridium botulinum (strain Eklund 17B / Type B) TaxID=935198 RepID=B2TKW2_CLOBB|nr:conserved hypothetical protein [Clostridium botulinum B str. Eklund 17B (NRP)]MBY6974550.1 hypothetical protein [Clostridium botulinum]MBY6999535.1 hypothetical protein [Clostridium botulinum]MCR1275242.1 hypothetical protein [Clostridium botulinum]NFD70522.1 hypothetical protein [Clostridium botulinum]
MIKYNKNMMDFLNRIDIYHKDFLDKIMRRWSEFFEIKGFVLLKKYKDTVEELDENKILSVYYDRTGYEASYNEFRIEDYFDSYIGKPMDGLALAIKLSEIWEYKLKRDFPSYKFHIIIGFDGNFTTIRFHRFRDEEGSWIALDNLDEYNGESIAVRIVE